MLKKKEFVMKRVITTRLSVNVQERMNVGTSKGFAYWMEAVKHLKFAYAWTIHAKSLKWSAKRNSIRILKRSTSAYVRLRAVRKMNKFVSL